MNYENRKLMGKIKRILLAIADVALFFLSNVLLCFLASDGKVFGSFYSSVLFDYKHFLLLSAAVVCINSVTGLYRRVWTYAGSDEIVIAAFASVLDSVMLFLTDKLIFRLLLQRSILPFYFYVLEFLFMLVCTCAPRIGYKIFITKAHTLGTSSNKKLKRVMIVGAGYMGNTIIENMLANQSEIYKPVIVVDDNPAKKNKRINNVKIVGSCEEIPQFAEKYCIDEIIICIPSAPVKRQKEIFKIAISTGKKVKTTPQMSEILSDGIDKSKKFRDVEITDLLSRDEVKLDVKVCKYLIDTTILVTGGGGSIGSEICMQCARYNPKKIIIFDIYENCAFELYNELKRKYDDKIEIFVRIGSVRDKERLEEIFEEFHPDVVFHTAAHKHVPLMEASPCEAVKNNVFGTYYVALAADKYKVPKMVILSTDKAVNPTNVMGCTKRITEIIVQYMNEISQNTQYAAVRFGNVLGSHGSVIPIFKKQIADGGPICVTHPDITRYFMTIPEAAQLVCQAGGLAKGGEIFVLDMGEPVRIMDLAKNLIELSGYTVDEIGIKITGLRPGEKLYEELSLDAELKTRQKTANEKIFVNQPMTVNKEEFGKMLNELENVNEANVREILKKIVPNFHPNTVKR